MLGHNTRSGKKKNLTSIREIITNLNSANLAKVEYSYILNQISTLITDLPLTAHVIPKETTLYRGVRYTEKPLSTSRLGYPPPENVTGYQRCNIPGKPMFYASMDVSAVFAEIEAKAGDKIYLSRWIVENDFFYFRIPPVGSGEVQNDPIFSRVATFFETKFTHPIHETFSEHYKITAAIAEKFSTGDLQGNEEFLNGRKLGGVVYPSVAYTARSDNIAIQPSIAESCLRLQDVRELDIKEAHSNENWVVQDADFSANFIEGEIIWAGRNAQWTLDPGESLTFTVENNEWVARKQDGSITHPF